MVQEIKENKDFLKSLAKATWFKRKSLLAKATPDQLKALQQIAYNIQQEVVPLTQTEVSKLIKGSYRKYLVAVGDQRKSIENRRKVLLQHGGFLQFIIPAALLYLKEYL